MNKENALELANKWINQRPMPQELSPDKIWEVLVALGFVPKGKLNTYFENEKE